MAKRPIRLLAAIAAAAIGAVPAAGCGGDDEGATTTTAEDTTTTTGATGATGAAGGGLDQVADLTENGIDSVVEDTRVYVAGSVETSELEEIVVAGQGG